jgi:hypothetical protein
LKEKHITKCGDEGDRCDCKGRVFYGRETDNKTLSARGASAAEVTPYLTPMEMFTFPWAEREANGAIPCRSDVFGEVARNVSKQCYCESENLPPKQQKCASEGEECVCSGKVFYGRENIGRFSPAPFPLMMRKPARIMPSHGSVACSNSAFGADPAPG